MKRTAWILLVCSLLAALPVARAASTNDPATLIGILMQNDMMYGADEYFGDSRDLLYADPVKPTPRTAATPTAAAPSSSGGGRHSDSSSSSATQSGSASSPSESSGTETPPASEPPPAPPVVPPAPPPCPT